jgi:hypothetical protein
VKLEISPIFRSVSPTEQIPFSPLFDNHTEIQDLTESICEKWAAYLKDYVERTAILFGKSELPWDSDERAILSTLSAAIVRGFGKSLVIEERGIRKNLKNGRNDLWATIPEIRDDTRRFSFYLEAKKSKTDVAIADLAEYLKSPSGISRVFRDYLKSRGERITRLSPFAKQKGRRHDHYVIGMLATRVIAKKRDRRKVDAALRETFNSDKVHLYIKHTGKRQEPDRHREMRRFPTVGLVLFPDSTKVCGLVATFTIFSVSRRIHDSKATAEIVVDSENPI